MTTMTMIMVMVIIPSFAPVQPACSSHSSQYDFCPSTPPHSPMAHKLRVKCKFPVITSATLSKNANIPTPSNTIHIQFRLAPYDSFYAKSRHP